jgi:hypothetical protein
MGRRRLLLAACAVVLLLAAGGFVGYRVWADRAGRCAGFPAYPPGTVTTPPWYPAADADRMYVSTEDQHYSGDNIQAFGGFHVEAARAAAAA